MVQLQSNFDILDVEFCVYVERVCTVPYERILSYFQFLCNCTHAFQDALLLNNNKLKTIPDEIVACEALEKLYLQNNVLHYIPFKLSAIVSATLRKQHILWCDNLKLRMRLIFGRRPSSNQNKQECLKDINCSGNETLSETIPIDMQGDRELILWILRLHTSYRDKIEITMDMYQTIEKSARDLELERVILHAELLKLQKDVETMRADHPLKYIELKEKTLIFLGKCRVKAREGLATGRKKLEQLLSRYKKAKIQAEEP